MNLEDHKQAFNKVGWFLPPYLQVGFLTMLKTAIENDKISDPHQLEGFLAQAYSPAHLAAMVKHRYPITPFVQEYSAIISEAIEAHFSGLGHAAVLGLLPPIEGAARKLADSRGIAADDTIGVKKVFTDLAADCKNEAVQRQIGDVGEILTMMDAFVEFTHNYLYAKSSEYPLPDRTNRHGILHGAFTDGDYGSPINFYKAIGSLDFLCMVSAFRAKLSWMAPDPDEASNPLAIFYMARAAVGWLRPA